jgi:tetratricopeptide (TPR) repeat protein
MKRLIKIIGIPLLMLALTVGAMASDPSGTESLFIFGAGARPLGMGGAYVAVADDGAAVYFNPAGMGFLQYREITLFNAWLNEGTDYLFGSAVYPILGFGAVGIAGARIGTDNIIFRDQFGQLGEFNYNDGQYWLSYGIKLFNNLSVGTNLKYINSSLGDFSTSTGSIDLGLLTHYKNIIFLGVNAQDILSGKMKLGTKGENIPSNIKGGIAVSYAWPEVSILLAADADKTEKVSTKLHLGGELGFKNTLFLRGGYDRTAVTFGAGIRYKLVEFDYAFKGNSDLGATHRWGISFFFGPTIAEQRENKIARQREEEMRRAEESRIAQMNTLLSKASGYYDAQTWDSAAVYYNQVLAYDPENVEAITRLREIQTKLASEAQTEIDTRAGQMAFEQLMEKYSATADSLYDLGEYENSRLEYEKMLELDSANVNASERIDLINLHFEQKVDSLKTEAERLINREDYAEAIVLLTDARALKPGDTEISSRLNFARRKLLIAQKLRNAINVLNSGDTVAAQEQFMEVLDIDPQEKVATSYLEQLHEKSQVVPVSIDEIKADPEYWKLYLDALELFGDGKYKEAIQKWEKVLEKYPGSEDTRENLRTARLRLGEGNQ